jgi:hypothetical protein
MEYKTEERVPNEVCSLNFSFLTNTFGKTQALRQAKKILNRDSGNETVDLSRLLRHHSQLKIRGLEVSQRHSIDDLLSFYSIIEISALIGYIRFHPIGPQLSEVYKHLSDPNVQRYYRDYYPMQLPQGLLRRFEVKPVLLESFQPHKTFPRFIHFLLLSQEMNSDVETKAFLSFLDSNTIKAGSSQSDLKNILSDQEKLLKVVGVKKSRSSQYKELRGYAKFITFSIELDEYLRSISEFPLFQSACYQYYKNLYSHYGRQLNDIVDQMALIMPQQEAVSEFDETNNISGVAAMQRLVSGQYGRRYEGSVH